MMTSSLGRFPKLVRRLRPARAEVEHYARLIAQTEQRPPSAWSACLAEAEIQLWAVRSVIDSRHEEEADAADASAA